MKEFNILYQKILFSNERVNYYLMTQKYQCLALESAELLKKKYSQHGSLKGVVEHLEEDALKIFYDVLEKSMVCIQQEGVYTVDLESLAKCCEECFEEFEEPFDIICDKYEEIVDVQREASEYRRERKASRTKYRGYGYGIGGAISSGIKAGTMNMATGIGHSLVNAIGNTGSGAVSSVKQSNIYNDKSVVNSLVNGMYEAVYEVGFEVMDIISEHTNIKYEDISEKEEAEARALSNNILRNGIPEDKLCVAIVRSLQLNPENEELMKYVIDHYGDADCEIEKLGDFFGFDLKKMKKKRIDEKFGKLEKKEYSTEEELIKEKEQIIQLCQKYGIENKEYVKVLDEKWQVIDKKLRTVEGVEYRTRDIARNVEKDISTFNQKCAEYDWNNINLLDENCKEKYEMEIKSINYLEKDFEVQIHERLDVVWEEYIYRQEIIQRLSDPETFLDRFCEIVKNSSFYEGLKKRIHFHDFVLDRKNKAPSFNREDGQALLFIDRTLMGGGKKGTVFTTRKLIEYDKNQVKQVRLAEITSIKTENKKLLVLDAGQNTIMTFEIPFLVADNQVKRYAALLDALALGIAKTDCSSLENNILAMNVMEHTGQIIDQIQQDEDFKEAEGKLDIQGSHSCYENDDINIVEKENNVKREAEIDDNRKTKQPTDKNAVTGGISIKLNKESTDRTECKKKQSVFGVISFIIGIFNILTLGAYFILGIVGIILGIIGIRDKEKKNGFAAIGLTLSVISLVIFAVMIIVALFLGNYTDDDFDMNQSIINQNELEKSVPEYGTNVEIETVYNNENISQIENRKTENTSHDDVKMTIDALIGTYAWTWGENEDFCGAEITIYYDADNTLCIDGYSWSGVSISEISGSVTNIFEDGSIEYLDEWGAGIIIHPANNGGISVEEHGTLGEVGTSFSGEYQKILDDSSNLGVSASTIIEE